MLLKYRLLSGNEGHGNYIVTGFIGFSFPTGSEAFTNNKAIITSTLAAGTGWGTREIGINVQSTIGLAIAVTDTQVVGKPLTWNTALQAQCLQYAGRSSRRPTSITMEAGRRPRASTRGP